MREREVEKTPGVAQLRSMALFMSLLLEISHPESEQIYDCIIQLTRQLEFAEFTYGLPKYYNDFLIGL